MVIYTGMPLLNLGPSPKAVFLFFLHISCTWIPQWRLWVPRNVCFREPSPDCHSAQTLPLCQNCISKPWVQFWREIKALSTQLSLEYFLYASHSMVSANNIFVKSTGLRWYNSVIIWMRELSGPVLLKEAKGNHIQNAKQQQNPYMKSWEKIWERPSSFSARSTLHRYTYLSLWMEGGQRYGSQEAHVKIHVLWFLYRFKSRPSFRWLPLCTNENVILCCFLGFWWVQAGHRGWCWTCAGDLNLWSICLSWEWAKLKTVLLG